MIYLGDYNFPDSKIKRTYLPTGVTLIHYLLKTLTMVYGKHHVFSFAANLEPDHQFYPAERKKVGQLNFYFPPSWGEKRWIHSHLLNEWAKLCLSAYCSSHHAH